jgi:hypothetical protein
MGNQRGGNSTQLNFLQPTAIPKLQ